MPKKTKIKTVKKKVIEVVSKKKKGQISLQTPLGTRDVLSEEYRFWHKIRQTTVNLAEVYSFKRINLPVLEDELLNLKLLGKKNNTGLDKSIYSLKPKGGEKLVLRSSFAPSICRAYLEDDLASSVGPTKLYTIGPLFDYREPGKGYWRQYHQVSFNALGEKDPVIDAQVIYLIYNILRELGLKNLSIQINSLGCPQCRPAYRKVLSEYYRYKLKLVCNNCRSKFKEEPVSLLNCKEEKCKDIIETAPQVIDYLCQDCHDHFKSVLEFLDELEIPYFLNSCLAGGASYYNRTIFQIWPEETESKFKMSLAGGGRYDNLMKDLGGQLVPAFGGGFSFERVCSLMKILDIKPQSKYQPKLFLIQLGDLGKKKSLKLFEDLRRSGLKVAESFSRDSIKGQLKAAEKNGVQYALILGQKETLDNTVIIREMKSGSQEIVPTDKIIKNIKNKLRG